MTTVAQALHSASLELTQASVERPMIDARILLERVLNESRGRLIAQPERMLAPVEEQAFAAFIARRAAREPISHILGEREFWSLPFKVTADTLAPRPESETLVEAALFYTSERASALKLLDLGTGTGCLLLALLSELPQATGIGLDISENALNVARENARLLALADRAEFVHSGWGSQIEGAFDLVVANPPYVPESEIEALAPEVARFESRLALSGGRDGFQCYREIATHLSRLLAPQGHALFEVGAGMENGVSAILMQHGMNVIETRADLSGIPRCVVARRAETF